MEITLSTLDEALRLMREVSAGRFTEEEANNVSLAFSGELSEIKIVVDGADYHGTIPGDLAKGIWEFQSEMYRAAAFALYGTNDSRKLTTEQREKFELIFEVSKGSSSLLATAKDTIEALKGCLDGMTGTQKLLGIVLLAIVITTGVTVMHISDNNKTVALEQEHTKQGQTIQATAVDVIKAQNIATRYAEANSAGITAIAKSACDATSIKFGLAALDASEISDINRKAERTRATAEVVDGPFMVFELNSKTPGKTTGYLCDHQGRDFSFGIDESEFDQQQVANLWDAAKLRKPINMQVTLTVGADGTIKKSQVIQIN